MTARWLILPTLCCWSFSLAGDPREDIESASPEVRAAAAKVLLRSFTPPPREKWEEVFKPQVKGMTREKLEEYLQPYYVIPGSGAGGGGGYSKSYRLDDCWEVVCGFLQKDDTLVSWKFYSSPKRVWVEPPRDFTGAWTTYHVNGQKSAEAQYVDGRRHGTGTVFSEYGAELCVEHYTQGLPDGETLWYYPSGRLRSRGFYKAGNPVGTWTHYKKDGTVESTTVHPAEKAGAADSGRGKASRSQKK
jgi:MORN repeat variant